MQELIERLERREARIGIFGLGYVGLPLMLRFVEVGYRVLGFDLESVALTPESLAAVEAVLIATDHDRFDYELIREHARLIVDTRGVYREPAEHIVRA